MPVYCTQCDRRLPPGDVRFCAHCGAKLQLPVAPTDEAATWKDRTPWGYADMAMAIAVVVGSVIIVLIPMVIIIGVIGGGALDDDDGEVRAVGIAVSFLLEGLLLVAAALFSVGKYKLSWSSLGLRLPKRGGYWFPLPLFFAALVVLGLYAAIVDALGIDPEGNVPEDAFDSTAGIVFLGVLSLALAPFMEEVFFRGFLFGGLRGRLGLLGAAFASGLLFALPHYAGVGSLSLIPAIGIIGMLFAWGYYYTGSLLAPVVAHFMFNLTSFLFGVLEVAG